MLRELTSLSLNINNDTLVLKFIIWGRPSDWGASLHAEPKSATWESYPDYGGTSHNTNKWSYKSRFPWPIKVTFSYNAGFCQKSSVLLDNWCIGVVWMRPFQWVKHLLARISLCWEHVFIDFYPPNDHELAGSPSVFNGLSSNNLHYPRINDRSISSC